MITSLTILFERNKVMAKKKQKATVNVSGMSVKDIINIGENIVKYNRSDLARIVGRLVSTANKRIRKLGETKLGQLSPAYRSRMGITKYKHSEENKYKRRKPRTYGFFTTVGKSRSQLLQEFKEAKGFLELKTSTIRGWDTIRHDIEKELGVELDTQRKRNKFWKVYRELTDGKNIPRVKDDTGSKFNSEQIQKLVAKSFKQKGGFNQKKDVLVEQLNPQIDKLYETATEDEETAKDIRRKRGYTMRSNEQEDGNEE